MIQQDTFYNQEVLVAAASQDFVLFAALMFPQIEPGKTMTPSWHINHIAYLAQEITQGRKKRSIVNLPPRSLKSILISVLLVAFLMGEDPTLRIIVASHTRSLARKLAADFRRVISSQLFGQIFPRFELAYGGDSAFLQRTTMNGHRIATSVGATITGEGADLIIVDDPNRAKDIYSEAHRLKVNTYFDQELSTRLNNKKTGKIIVVMQRFHEDDLTGHLLDRSDQWHHCVVQAICTEPRSYRVGHGPDDLFHRSVGDILLPQMNDEDTLEDARATNGSINFEAQYQQNPSPETGVIIQREWLHYYGKAPDEFDYVTVSWDLASTSLDSSDYSVGTVWGLKGQYFYLLDVLRLRVNSPTLRRIIEETHIRYNADQTIIEKAGLGHSIGEEMRAQSQIRPHPIPVSAHKPARLMAQSAKFENGQVLLPRDAPWLGVYQHEMLSFPNARYDDQVDSTSQALKYLTRKLSAPKRAPKNERQRQRPQGKIGSR